MKRIFSVVLALLFACSSFSVSLAETETVDMPFRGLWFDQNDIKIYCTNYGVLLYGLRGPEKEPTIQMDFIAENNSDKPIRAGIEDIFANGWSIWNYQDITGRSLDPGKKNKESIKLDLTEAGMKTLDEITEFEFVLWVDLNNDSYDDERIKQKIVIRSFPLLDENNEKKEDKLVIDDAVKAIQPTEWPELIAETEAEPDMKMQGLWFNKDGIKIYCVNYGLTETYRGPTIQLDFVVENRSNKVMSAGIKNDYANGWSIGTIGNFCNNEVLVGKRARGIEQIDLRDAEIKEFSQLEDYEFTFWVLMDNDNYPGSLVEIKMKMNEFPIYDETKEKIVGLQIKGVE